MNTTEKGTSFEKKVLNIVQDLLKNQQFSVSGNCWEVFYHKGYWSALRKKEIVVDISVEFRRAKETSPSLIVFIECKDYQTSVPVNDVEEFHSKIQQISGVNAKAMLFTRSNLQAGSFNMAQSLGMAVIRVLSDDDLYWLIERTNRNLTSPIENTVSFHVFNALTNENFVSTRRDTFVLYKDIAGYDLGIIFGHLQQEYQ